MPPTHHSPLPTPHSSLTTSDVLIAHSSLSTILRDIHQFSARILRLRLHHYQVEPLRAIIHSILHKQGHEFLLVFPRQSGKNEAIAQLLVYLLILLQRAGGNIVYAAIGDGIGRGIRRLEEHLHNPLTTGQWAKRRRPESRTLGKAAIIFLSSHPSAKVRGETAHHLLLIDEAQDQIAHHIESVFTPMRAANNATAVYLGTVRTTSDFLWIKKQELEQLEKEDHIRRIFFVSPAVVTGENPDYGRFLAAQITKYGRNHPIIQAEYFLQPFDNEGGLFPDHRRRLMLGQHYRRQGPEQDRTPLYIATVDVAGQDERATEPLLTNPGRDYTICTIFELNNSQLTIHNSQFLPVYHAIDLFVDHGSRHFQETPGQPSLAHRLLGFLNHWQVANVIIDASGVGQGLSDWLTAELGKRRVTPYLFSGKGQKAMLGSRFIALIETNRFKYWCGDEHEPLSDGWWFQQQVTACTYTIPPRGIFERDLQWGVPENKSVDTLHGRQPIHDDRLISAALIAEYDYLARQGQLTLGLAESYIIPPFDSVHPPSYIKWDLPNF